MKHAATQELFSYWNRLRGERMAPERADIDPAAIRGVLADTFILDVSSADSAPLRVVGARFNALFVSETKGFDFLKMWRPESRSAIAELLECTAAEPAPALAGVRAAPAGRPELELELLLLPLRHFGRTRARIMGCLSPAAVPLWLGLVPISGLGLGPMRILRCANADTGDFARPSTAGLPQRHGHLHVHTAEISAQSSALEETR